MAKRDHMNRAQHAINDVNYKLKRLKKELSDINEHVCLEIKIDDYLSFADYFFDGFFVDMMVQNKINESQAKVSSLNNDIETLKKYLKNMRLEAEAEKVRLGREMDQVILSES
jgi:peptidoglycan hydrolase CwlO-like protein